MDIIEAENLRREIAYVFETGANEIRIFDIVNNFIERREKNKLPIHNISNLLIAWEQYKKIHWWESDAIDVENLLMERFLNTINPCI